MRPPQMPKIDYERIPLYGEWVKGKIADIEYDMEHKSIWEGKERVRPAVRFKFELEGCKFTHRSNWMTFSLGEKTGLFTKYVADLVEGAQPDMDIDLDILKNLEVKTMWKAKGEYDNLLMIMPLGAKVSPGAPVQEEPPEDAAATETEIPF